MEILLKQTFEKYGYELTDKQVGQFAMYYKFLIEENKKFNLTSITEEKEVIFKHFLDSVLTAKDIAQNAKIIDVGTGAGFPGIPLKILRPDIEITLLDSLQKRVNFLKQVVELLGLEKVNCVHDRAEDYCKKTRENFDIALSRAVAQIPTLAEYLLPFVKIGGKVIMYKAQKADEEVELGKKAIETLGGKIANVSNITIAEIDAQRTLVYISKIKSTPTKYPRAKNLPKTKPIV
jgi:16S rRNA (guanine527-N7)-methyltransferase